MPDALRNPDIPFRNLFETMPQAVVYQDATGKIIAANQAAETILGLHRDEMTGLTSHDPHWKAIHPDGSEFAGADHPAMVALKTGETIKEVVMGVFNPAADSYRWIKVDAIPAFRPGESQPFQVYSIFEDISDKIKIEAELRESEDRYASLFHSSQDAIFIHDLEGRIIDANQKVLSLFGYTRPEIETLPVSKLHPDTARAKSKWAFETIQREGAVRFETDFLTKDGQVFRGEVTSSLFEIGGKKLIQGIVRDITNRQEAAKALRDSNERFITVLNSIDATIYVADLETYEIIFANDRMKQTYGRDVTGEICYKVFRKRSDPCPHCTNDQLVDKHGNPTGVCVWQAENPVVKKWYINYDRAIRWIDGRLVRLQIAVDITHLKKVARQLLQAQKFEALGTLAGGIAHQFNNILGGLTGYLDLLAMHHPQDDKTIKYIGRMKSASMRMAQLTSQLVAYARGGKYQAKDAPLSELIREAFPLARHALVPQLIVDLDLPYESRRVAADPTQMQLVLSSLLVNASEAITEENGRIQVTCRNEAVDENTAAEHPGLTAGNYAVLTVKDNGIGMDPETLSRVFEPFFTTKFEGRGLGMAAVYGIVKNHNGWIGIASEPGAGTTVDVYLPVRQPSSRS